MRFLFPIALLLAGASLVLADWAEDVKAFKEAYKSDHPDNRIAAVQALEGADNAEAVRLLIVKYQGESDARVSEAIAEVLAGLRADGSRRAIREEFASERNETRRAKLCGLLNDGRNLDRGDLLKRLLADPSEKVRIAACGAICHADVSIIPAIAKAGGMGSGEARAAAMTALGQTNSIEAVSALIDGLGDDKAPVVRKAAEAALVRMSDRNWGNDAAAWRNWSLEEQARGMTPVDRAILLGAANLKAQLATLLQIKGARPVTIEGPDPEPAHLIPLLTYALHHAGLTNDDPVMLAAVAYLKAAPLDFTYTASIQALALADIDAKAHAGRLSEIAQWLTDQQCTNGQWSYGHLDNSNSVSGAPVASGGGFPVVWREGSRRPSGDGSNHQFAILALRAAHDAGVVIPKIVWERSLEWYVKNEGLVNEAEPKALPGKTTASTDVKPGGWGYAQGRLTPYHSMTCSGLCAVTICLRALGRDKAFRDGRPADEPMIGRGLKWLDAHWGEHHGWMYYSLYSLERVGMILNVEKIGDHDWYAHGVDKLLPRQAKNGSWDKSAIDTAFAILFLKRATRGYPSVSKDK